MAEKKCSNCRRPLTEEDVRYCCSCNAPLCKLCYDKKNGYCDSCELNFPRVMF
ncbi:MAG: hypothetical protein R2876_06405 [Eubacteriales bacterium]